MSKIQAFGSAVLNSVDDLEPFKQLMEDYRLFKWDGVYESEDGLPFIEFNCEQKDYEEGDFKCFYSEASKYVKSADIEFAAEDDTHWKHQCENGQWTEIEGKVVYDTEHAKPFAESLKSLDEVEWEK